VRLAIYDAEGRLVKELEHGSFPAGVQAAVWDGRDDSGRGVGSGSYFARLEAGGRVATVRVGLIR
jgi:flagellar hook assembly protein FlgD